MLAGDLGRRTGRSDSYPRSSLGVPRQVLTHGAVTLTFREGVNFLVAPPYHLQQANVTVQSQSLAVFSSL